MDLTNPYRPPASELVTERTSPAEIEPFTSVFGLLGRAFGLYFGNLGTIAAITLIVFAPVEIIKNFLITSRHLEENIAAIIRIEGIIETVFGALVAPAVIAALVHKLETGRALGVGAALSAGFRRWLNVFGARLVSGLMIGLWSLLLIVPGLIWAVRYSVTDPVASLEPPGKVNGVLRRSSELVKGYGLKVFGVGILALLVVFATQFVGGIVSALVEFWPVTAAMDCIYDVVYRLLTAVMLLVYLGVGGSAGSSAPDTE